MLSMPYDEWILKKPDDLEKTWRQFYKNVILMESDVLKYVNLKQKYYTESNLSNLSFKIFHLKFGNSEKATKIWPIFHVWFDATKHSQIKSGR